MRVVSLLCGLSCVVGLAACQNGNTAAPTGASVGDPQVVATVNGEAISNADLAKAAAGPMKQVESQMYQIKKNALDDLVEERLVAAAAKKAGKSVDEYLQGEFGDQAKEPTLDEMKKFYEQRKGQIGDKSFDQVKDQIKQFLTQSKTQGARQALMGKLRASADIRVHLEPPRTKVEAGDNPSRGPANAPIQIVEWADYQCPFCGKSRPTLNQILSTYGDKVRYTIRDFPLGFHQHAVKAHEAAHCAGEQGKYWEMNTSLFEHNTALEVAKLKEYARQIKLDGAKFDKCLDSGKFAKKVTENQEAGSAVGVTGTPSFFVNGVNISGAQPFENFKTLIESELAKKK